MIEYLYDNPAKGQAWAQAQGVPFSQLGEYIRSLDACVLADTALVINHGFDAMLGTATAIEATLDVTTNPGQADADGNGTGDACESNDGGVPNNPQPSNPCPSGFEPDPHPSYANDPAPPCYPACSTGVMTPGGTCCGLTQAEVQQLGCCALTCPASTEPGVRLDADGLVTTFAEPDDTILGLTPVIGSV